MDIKKKLNDMVFICVYVLLLKLVDHKYKSKRKNI